MSGKPMDVLVCAAVGFFALIGLAGILYLIGLLIGLVWWREWPWSKKAGLSRTEAISLPMALGTLVAFCGGSVVFISWVIGCALRRAVTP